MADVRELARQLGEAVVTDEKFVALQSAQAEYDNDAELQQLIQEFNLQKMNVMQEMQKGEEKNEEKLKEHQDKGNAHANKKRRSDNVRRERVRNDR